jgi:AcrR family transcriptional regulator
MGRRSSHTPDELRDLILDAARAIIEKDGLAGLSARTIAKRIGYSPGTLYNVFDNLNDILLNVEGRLLEDLDQRIIETAVDVPPKDRLTRLAHCYLRFTQDRPRLWNLLLEHQPPHSFAIPDWYQERLSRLLTHVEEALEAHMPGRAERDVQHSARVVWAGVHGITSLATANKLTSISSDHAALLIEDLLSGYIRGLEMRPTSKV